MPSGDALGWRIWFHGRERSAARIPEDPRLVSLPLHGVAVG